MNQEKESVPGSDHGGRDKWIALALTGNQLMAVENTLFATGVSKKNSKTVMDHLKALSAEGTLIQP